MDNFRFSLDSFEILTTRSLLKDTDTVSFCIGIVGRGEPQVQSMFMGDVDNGFHKVNLVFDNIQLADNDIVIITYHITNKGGNRSDVAAYAEDTAKTLLEKGIDSVISKGIQFIINIDGNDVPIIGSAINKIGSWLTGSIFGFIHANCDGPVAAGIHVFTGLQLKAILTNKTFATREYNPGVDSAAGCGNNSRYFVTWSMTWTNKPIDPCELQVNALRNAQNLVDSLEFQIEDAGGDSQALLPIGHNGGSGRPPVSIEELKRRLAKAKKALDIAQTALTTCRIRTNAGGVVVVQ